MFELLLVLVVCVWPAARGDAQVLPWQNVLSSQKISDLLGNFSQPFHNSTGFGRSVAFLGNLRNDGTTAIAVGLEFDSEAGQQRGAVSILFLNTAGNVVAFQKINDVQGGFTGTLTDYCFFGVSVASIGDLNDDGVIDIAVGAYYDDDGGPTGTERGAVWILFLNATGTVKSHQKISANTLPLMGLLDLLDNFGISVSGLGDLDGDSVEDIAVGAFRDDDGGQDRGAVYILFLRTNGTVKAHRKISNSTNFGGSLTNSTGFGISVASIGDLDGDSITELAVGAWMDDCGKVDAGAVWILFLNSSGFVKSSPPIQKICDRELGGILNSNDWFGFSVAALGDWNGDSVKDIIVGSQGNEDGTRNTTFFDHGAAYIVFLNATGMVKSFLPISATRGGFKGTLDTDDRFGSSVAALGDLNGDSVGDLAIGAYTDDDGGFNRGAVWIVFGNSTFSATSTTSSVATSSTSSTSISSSATASTGSSSGASSLTSSVATSSSAASTTASIDPGTSEVSITGDSDSSLALIVGVVIGGVVVCCVAAVALVYWRSRATNAPSEDIDLSEEIDFAAEQARRYSEAISSETEYGKTPSTVPGESFYAKTPGHSESLYAKTPGNRESVYAKSPAGQPESVYAKSPSSIGTPDS